MTLKYVPLDRPIQLMISQNGAVFTRDRSIKESRGQQKFFRGLLPFCSVNTADEAEALVVWFCKLSREDNMTYFIPEFSGKVDDLNALGQEWEKEHQRRLVKKEAAS